ncbi:type II toxin-antitoxin system PemK/MazF family toxin [Patescibacteria group bacterium]|nr:type II toxin-antitoxin system PemK/MazF family toxin [Patescibacteria group bacterium]
MYKQGDIIIFNCQKTNKLKTGLIISNDNFGKTYKPSILIFPVISKETADRYSFRLLTTSLKTGKLVKEAYVDCHKMEIIDEQHIKKSVAQIRENQATEIINKFINLIKQNSYL